MEDAVAPADMEEYQIFYELLRDMTIIDNYSKICDKNIFFPNSLDIAKTILIIMDTDTGDSYHVLM